MAALQQKPVRGERRPTPVSPGRGKPPGGSSPEILLQHQNHFKVSHDPNHWPWRVEITDVSIGCFSLHRQQLQLVSPAMPGPAEVSGQSLKDVLAAMGAEPQPLGMASLPFRRVCTHCPSVSDATNPQNSPGALPQAGHLWGLGLNPSGAFRGAALV